MTIRRVEREEVVEMLQEAAEAEGLTLARFAELGREGQLANPRLRDLWLIWGDALAGVDSALAV